MPQTEQFEGLILGSGENVTTAAQAAGARATAIVAGSAIFGAKDYAAAITAICASSCVEAFQS